MCLSTNFTRGDGTILGGARFICSKRNSTARPKTRTNGSYCGQNSRLDLKSRLDIWINGGWCHLDLHKDKHVPENAPHRAKFISYLWRPLFLWYILWSHPSFGDARIFKLLLCIRSGDTTKSNRYIYKLNVHPTSVLKFCVHEGVQFVDKKPC